MTTWTPFTAGSVAETALARTKNGPLHVVWREATRLMHAVIPSAGPPAAIGADWGSTLSAPWLIAAPDGSLQVLFTTKNGLHTATSKDAGAKWDVAPPSAHASPLFAATGDKDGKPFTISAADVRAGADHLAVALDAESFEGWAAWHEGTGLYAKAVKPAAGVAQLAPTSKLAPSQRLALAPRIGAPGVYLAYCEIDGVKLWNVRGGEALSVARAAGARNAWIAPAPDGRLWILWTNLNNTVSAMHSNKSLQRFSRPYTLTSPGPIRSVAAEGSTGPLDVIVGGSHTRLVPELELVASPEGVRVMDLGDPVEGAQVEVWGKTIKTDAKGLAAGTGPLAKVIQAGYAPATLQAQRAR